MNKLGETEQRTADHPREEPAAEPRTGSPTPDEPRPSSTESSPKTWNPVDVFQKLFQENRPAAVFLLTGLGVLAAIAIAQTFQIDFASARLLATYIFGSAALTYLLLAIFGDQAQVKVLAWFVVVALITYSSAVLVAAMAPGIPFLKPVQCLLRPLEKCDEALDESALRNFSEPPLIQSPVAPPAAPVKPSDYVVRINFAGDIPRDRVQELAKTLAHEGWQVKSENGGRRTPEAYGLNEVRYSGPSTEGAARRLARAVQAARLVDAAITLKPATNLPPNELEVWFSLK